MSTKAWRERNAEHIRQWRKTYSERSKARNNSHPYRNLWAQIRVRVQRGTLKRQPCVFCGALNGHAHHEDYEKPLEIVWVCPKHHAEIHSGLLKVLPHQITTVPKRAKRRTKKEMRSIQLQHKQEITA